MKRLLSLFLALCMLVLAVPMAALPLLALEEEDGGGEGGDVVVDENLISRYTDYAKNFTVNVYETSRNAAGLSTEDYKAALLDPTSFAIDLGENCPWQVGTVSKNGGTFTPYTRVLPTPYDQTIGGVANTHDLTWASTEAEYCESIEEYVGRITETNVAVNIWATNTPLWYWGYALSGTDPTRTYLSNGSTDTISAMLYTVEEDCTVNISIEALDNYRSHYFAILLDGVMIWPKNGGSLTNTNDWYALPANGNVNEAEVIASLLNLDGTELEAGQELAFCLTGGSGRTAIEPVIKKHTIGETNVALVDSYGSNSAMHKSLPGEEFTIPEYQGDLIFLGWDADDDGVPDYADGATFVVPEVANVVLTAIVIAPSNFENNLPIYDAVAEQIVYRGNWEVGRYVKETGVFEKFSYYDPRYVTISGSPLLNPYDGNGGGMYLSSGKMPLSGCEADEPYLLDVYYTAPYSGEVTLDFTKLIARREVNAADIPNYIAFNLAVYKNGVKIFPTDTEFYSYQSEQIYEARQGEENFTEQFRTDGGFPMNLTVEKGDTFEVRVQQGNNESWMFHCSPIVSYLSVSETPLLSGASVSIGSEDLALNIYSQIIAPRENVTAGLLYWTEEQTEYVPSTGTPLTGELDGMAYKFSYRGLSAKEMGKVLYVMAYSTVDDGETYYSDVKAVSIASYVESALGRDRDLDKFLLAMINYGAEAQNYFGYDIENLANAFLDEEQKDTEIADPVSVYNQGTDGQKIKSVSLLLDNRLGFKFMTDKVEGATAYVLEFADNPEFTDAVTVDMVATEAGSEYKANVAISNTEFAKTFYARVKVDGVAGATLTYSVETYVARMSEEADDRLFFLMNTLVAFGRVCAEVQAD